MLLGEKFMPTSKEELWPAIESRNFDKVATLIKNDTDLINAINPNGGSSLAIYLLTYSTKLKETKPRALLNYIFHLKDENNKAKLNWDFQNNCLTTSDALLTAVSIDRDFSVIRDLHDVDGFLFNNKQLTYDLARASLLDAETVLQNRTTAKKPAKDILKAQESVDKWKEIVSVIREMTIPFAKKTGNAELLRRLEQDKATAALEASLKSLSANLARYGALKTERQQIQQDHALKELELAQQNAQDMQDLLSSAVTATAR